MMPFDPRMKTRRAAQRPDGVSRHPWRAAAAFTSSTVRPICSNRNEERAAPLHWLHAGAAGRSAGALPRALQAPPRPVPADHIQGRPVPRRGWKWWTCENGGMPHFHGPDGNHFHTDLVKMPEQVSRPVFGRQRRTGVAPQSRPRDFRRRSEAWIAMLACLSGESVPPI